MLAKPYFLHIIDEETEMRETKYTVQSHIAIMVEPEGVSECFPPYILCCFALNKSTSQVSIFSFLIFFPSSYFNPQFVRGRSKAVYPHLIFGL